MYEPKKHHYLPQFYLDRFKIIPQQGKYAHIYRIEKSALPKAMSTAIKDTGCKRDYHTLDFDKKDRDRQTVEKVLSKIESNQAYLISSICENVQISEEYKFPLAEFITTMRFRVPSFKRNIESSLKSVVKSTFKILMHQGKFSQPPRELEAVIQEQGYDFLKVRVSNWKILQHMFEMAFQSENATILEKMKFQLVMAPEGHQFITGDSPVALYHPDYDSIKPYGVGPAFKEVELTLPISKKLLIKLSWDSDEGILNANEKEVHEYNRRTIIMADSTVYASEQRQDLIEKISLYHKIKAGYQTDNLWYGKGAAHIQRLIPVTK